MTEEDKKNEEEEEEEGKKDEPDFRQLLDEKEKELQEIRKKLDNLENKDFNFKRLRDMTETEREKLSAMEQGLLERQEKLEDEQKTWKEKIIDGHKDDALAVLVGDDDELRKKVIFHYDRIKDEALSKEEINKKMRDAYLLAVGKPVSSLDPIARAAAYYSGHGVVKTGAKLTEDQQDLAQKLGISDEDVKKYLG